MNKQFTNKFSKEWIAAWNSHDLDKIMHHYSDDFEMHSPVIREITGEKNGTLKGKTAIRDYWKKALDVNPGLHFELMHSFSGTNSIVIQYKGHRGLSAEVFIFNRENKVISAFAHYE